MQTFHITLNVEVQANNKDEANLLAIELKQAVQNTHLIANVEIDDVEEL